MPEQPEIHFLWYFGAVFGFVLLCGFYGAFLQWRCDKANEERRRKAEKFTPTHR
ncbi:hypothetical protein LCGC14_1407250, partial [marine sediment metagenome]